MAWPQRVFSNEMMPEVPVIMFSAYSTAALLRRGYAEADIRKIMGGNFLRVMTEVVGN